MMNNTCHIIEGKTAYHISPREIEVWRLISYEYTTKEIADRLCLSEHTVTSHRKNLMHKLDVKNTAGMIRRGFEIGMHKMN